MPSLKMLAPVGITKYSWNAQLVARVRAAVDHVEARHWHQQLVVPGEVCKVAVERDAAPRRRARDCERDAECSVRAELALVIRAVDGVHRLVDRRLLQHVHPHDLGRNAARCVAGLRRQHALAHRRARPISQLDGFVPRRGGDARHRRALCIFPPDTQVDLTVGLPARIIDHRRARDVRLAAIRTPDAKRAHHLLG